MECLLCSLVPHGYLHFQAVALAIFGRAEVFLDLFLVASVLDIQLASLHVLHLWVILELLHVNVVATDEEHALDLEVWLLAEHAHFTEGVLLEAFKSLNETLEQVLELVGNLALLSELVVVKEPEGPACMVDQVHHLRVAVVHLVLQVDEERLEVVDDELGWRQGIKWVLMFLLLFDCWLGLSSGGFWLFLWDLGLLLSRELRWLDRLGTCLDVSKSGDEWRQL